MVHALILTVNVQDLTCHTGNLIERKRHLSFSLWFFQIRQPEIIIPTPSA